jgi:hypothetical protein
MKVVFFCPIHKTREFYNTFNKKYKTAILSKEDFERQTNAEMCCNSFDIIQKTKDANNMDNYGNNVYISYEHSVSYESINNYWHMRLNLDSKSFNEEMKIVDIYFKFHKFKLCKD